ncbi:MAG: T9SS type A sorting domain-containing protein [Bacteroidota bacterium]
MNAQSTCASPGASSVLDVNNVAIHIGPSGNTGFDVPSLNAGYEVPIGSNTFSIFAMSTWIGGITPDQQLRFAGQLYRQNGDSFWPGPLPFDGSLNLAPSVCADFDNIWEVTREEVELHREYFDRLAFDAINGTNTASDPPFENGYTIPDNILNWPGSNLDPAYTTDLAPYIDVNSDQIYNPNDGDYPAFYHTELGDPDLDFHLFGDKVLWWIYNDYGNIHLELPSDPMGVEIECVAYAYSDIVGLENTIFFRKKLTNRSTQTFGDTYLSQWVDGDLGCYQDDYIASEVQQALGITYNGDEEDEDCGINGYGSMPPAVGTDILRGPLADEGDGIDNNLNGEIDEDGEFWTMSHFTYFQNSPNPLLGNPSTGLDAYNLMRGFWLNGQQVSYGGDGTGIGSEPCKYVFPGDSDPNNVGTDGVEMAFDWTESQAGNAPGDRRYIQTAGPFTFEPGESIYSHSALIWAQSEDTDDPFSIEAIKESDILAQDAFDANFQELVSGLSEPTVKVPCDLNIRNTDLGAVQIDLNSISKNSLVQLFNLQGQQVYGELKASDNYTEISDLKAGIYFLQIQEGSFVCTQKIFAE